MQHNHFAILTNFLAKESVKTKLKNGSRSSNYINDTNLADEEGRGRSSNFDDQILLTFADCSFAKKYVEIAK